MSRPSKHVVMDETDADRIQAAKKSYYDETGIWLSTKAIMKVILDAYEKAGAK